MGWGGAIQPVSLSTLSLVLPALFCELDGDSLGQAPMDQGEGPAPGGPMSLALYVPSWVWVDLRPPEGSGARLRVLGMGSWWESASAPVYFVFSEPSSHP